VPESPRTLILFARAPVPGSVKTRLAGVLAPEGAARLYRAFLEDAARVYAGSAWSAVLYADPDPDETSLAAIFGEPWRREAQGSGDLGSRLTAAFEAERSRGASAVLAVGSDHPALPRRSLEELFDAVERGEDVALIPAQDGGYCAIALAPRAATSAIFRDIPWSSDRTLAVTVARAREEGLRAALLAAAYDVDRPEDLQTLARDLARRDPADGDYPHATARALARLAASLSP
jgi:rSAM/selenodomain-associated transferase 1